MRDVVDGFEISKNVESFEVVEVIEVVWVD